MKLVLEVWLDDEEDTALAVPSARSSVKDPWHYRVQIAPRLTIYGFTTDTDIVQIGLKAKETLPHTHDASDIYEQLVAGHIKGNISPIACVAAIKMIQEFIRLDGLR